MIPFIIKEKTSAEGRDLSVKMRELETPAILVRSAALRQNMKTYQRACDAHGKQLWPMVKTHKSTEMAKMQQELGAQGCSFPPLICFGANGAEPHHGTDDTVLKKGDSIILDVGVKLNDYCADMTRTLFFGEPTEEMLKVYNLVKAANEAGRAAVRPGEPMKNFDRAARKVIEDGGYGPYFTHRTGHGIGLEVHEYPDNSATSEIIAQPGMTFSVEPGIYLPGRFGVRVEDLVAVTEDGCETLNQLTKEFRIVG